MPFLRQILFLALVCLTACPGASPVAGHTTQSLAEAPGYRSLALHWSSSGVELVKQRRVAGELQRLKVPLEGPWRVDLLGADGAVVFTTQLPAPNLVRAEGFAGEAPALARQPDAAFLVNVPAQPEVATLQVWAQRWTLSEAGAGSQEWVKIGELPLGSTP